MRFVKELFSGIVGLGVGLLGCGLWLRSEELLWGAGWTIGVAIVIRAIIHREDA